MDNLARLRPISPYHTSATVLRAEDGGFRARTDTGEIRCRRAASCLLEPSVGDRVLVFADTDGRNYILAVLERPEGAPGEVVVEGDLRWVSRAGAMHFTAPKGIHLESRAEVTAVTDRFRLVAESAQVATRSVLAVGERIDAQFQKVAYFARSLDAFVDHVATRCKTALRVTEQTESVRAGRLDYRADELLTMRGENTVLTAEELVKVDGKQMHLG
jgi:hypothetical protein